MTNDNMQNSLLEKLHTDQSGGGEYAEPNYVRYTYSLYRLIIFEYDTFLIALSSVALILTNAIC